MEGAAYRRRIHDTFAGTGGDVSQQIRTSLSIGAEYLGLPIGFLTRIDDGEQEFVHTVGAHPLIQSGRRCPLEDGYCRRTIEFDSALAIQDATESAEVSDTALETFDLGSYVGVRVDVNDEIYGTVCFADDEPRAEPFSESQETFVELLGVLIGQAIEHRRYERELQQRNTRLETERNRLSAIAENSFDVLYRLDRSAEFTYVSSAVERVLGYSPQTLVGTRFTEYVREESIPRAKQSHETILSGEPIEALVLEFTDADGEPVLIEVNATPIVDDGQIVGSQGVGRDVTERQERERELRLKNRAIENAEIGISIADATDPELPLVYVNDGFEELTGYEAEDVLGDDWRILGGPATDQDVLDAFAERVLDFQPTSTEIITYRADGSPFWARARVSPIQDVTGEVTHLIGFHDDITARKRTEQLVRLLNRVLRHNLRNDMNAVLGYADLVVENASAEVAEFGEEIERTAQSLVDLADKANDLERVARQERIPKRLEPERFLRTIVEEHRNAVPDASVDLDVACDRDVVAGSELVEAVGELVTNAIVHNPAPDPWVGVRATESEAWIELTVVDDGPGIDELETAMIETGSETPLEHGSGLGLWLVNWIVTRYGGSFRIEAAEESAGTIATLELPAIDAGTSIEAAARPATVLFR